MDTIDIKVYNAKDVITDALSNKGAIVKIPLLDRNSNEIICFSIERNSIRDTVITTIKITSYNKIIAIGGAKDFKKLKDAINFDNSINDYNTFILASCWLEIICDLLAVEDKMVNNAVSNSSTSEETSDYHDHKLSDSSDTAKRLREDGQTINQRNDSLRIIRIDLTRKDDYETEILKAINEENGVHVKFTLIDKEILDLYSYLDDGLQQKYCEFSLIDFDLSADIYSIIARYRVFIANHLTKRANKIKEKFYTFPYIGESDVNRTLKESQHIEWDLKVGTIRLKASQDRFIVDGYINGSHIYNSAILYSLADHHGISIRQMVYYRVLDALIDIYENSNIIIGKNNKKIKEIANNFGLLD